MRKIDLLSRHLTMRFVSLGRIVAIYQIVVVVLKEVRQHSGLHVRNQRD